MYPCLSDYTLKGGTVTLQTSTPLPQGENDYTKSPGGLSQLKIGDKRLRTLITRIFDSIQQQSKV